MNKNKITIIAIAIFFIALFLSNYDKVEVKGNKITDVATQISTTKYLELKKENKVNIFYIGSTTCSYCTKFSPVLAEVIEEYDLDVYYVNIAEESSADVQKIDASDEKLKGFGTPTTAITQNDKVIYINIGYVEKDKLVRFFKDSKIITE